MISVRLGSIGLTDWPFAAHLSNDTYFPCEVVRQVHSTGYHTLQPLEQCYNIFAENSNWVKGCRLFWISMHPFEIRNSTPSTLNNTPMTVQCEHTGGETKYPECKKHVAAVHRYRSCTRQQHTPK